MPEQSRGWQQQVVDETVFLPGPFLIRRPDAVGAGRGCFDLPLVSPSRLPATQAHRRYLQERSPEPATFAALSKT